jgi:hypothetical protein
MYEVGRSVYPKKSIVINNAKKKTRKYRTFKIFFVSFSFVILVYNWIYTRIKTMDR